MKKAYCVKQGFGISWKGGEAHEGASCAACPQGIPQVRVNTRNQNSQRGALGLSRGW